MKKKMLEMQEEQDRLDQIQQQMNEMSAPAAQPKQDKEELDSRSIYVGNVCCFQCHGLVSLLVSHLIMLPISNQSQSLNLSISLSLSLSLSLSQSLCGTVCVELGGLLFDTRGAQSTLPTMWYHQSCNNCL
jgi:hypothetical protein